MVEEAANRTTALLINNAAWAVSAAYALTTVHHIYGGLVDNIPSRLIVPAIMSVPLIITLGLLNHYRRTGSRIVLAVFIVVSVLAFTILSGILHGVYAHLYKDLLFLVDGSPALYVPLNPDEHYPPDNLFFEITGVLEVVTGWFVALTAFRLYRNRSGSHIQPAGWQAELTSKS